MERVSRIYVPHTRLFTRSIAIPPLVKRDRTLILNPGVAARRSGLLPFWAIAGMIILASIGVCSTIIARSRSQLRTSSFQYYKMVSEIDLLRRHNASLETETNQLTTDARLIECEARSRLGMVRPNEIVVVDERMKVDSNSRVVSFVH